MRSWLRWLLTIPASILAWFVTAFVGMLFHGYAERAWCPPEEFISGYCMNKVAQARIDYLITIFAGLSAVAVIGAATAMAPARKLLVAWCAFGIGVLWAASVAFGSREFYSAVLLGALTCLAFSVYLRR